MIGRRLIAIWLVLLALACAAQIAESQPPDRQQLVAMWISEAGWRAHREHAIQAHILRRRAERLDVPLSVAIDLFVWRFSRPPRWVRNVWDDCGRPNGWPRYLLWPAHADECRELFSRADSFARGELSDPCPMALGWRRRGPALAEALARGRKLVRCGRTANAYVR